MAGIDPISTIANLGSTVINKIWGDKMPEADRIKMENEWNLAVMQEGTKENGAFRQFVLDYEGSAKDYKDIWLIGPLILVIRGLIRPGFTVATAWWDWLYFRNIFTSTPAQTVIKHGEELVTQQIPPEAASLLMAINLIVLIFWFGERSVKYVMPLLNPIIQAWTGHKLAVEEAKK